MNPQSPYNIKLIETLPAYPHVLRRHQTTTLCEHNQSTLSAATNKATHAGQCDAHANRLLVFAFQSWANVARFGRQLQNHRGTLLELRTYPGKTIIESAHGRPPRRT